MSTLRFWRRKRIMPGVTVNLSKSGASLSLGPRGAHYTVGPSGQRVTVGLPGSGLFLTEKHEASKGAHPPDRVRLWARKFVIYFVLWAPIALWWVFHHVPH
jgi:Protein of unknown function (DUF4236)